MARNQHGTASGSTWPKRYASNEPKRAAEGTPVLPKLRSADGAHVYVERRPALPLLRLPRSARKRQERVPDQVRRRRPDRRIGGGGSAGRTDRRGHPGTTGDLRDGLAGI